jgi:DNA-binding CsgD family transcriptional regulator
MWREIGDRYGIAESTAVIGLTALSRGDYETARSRLQKARGNMEELGDPRGIAKTTVGLADVDLNDGDQGAAQALYEEALMLLRDVGDKWWIAWCLEGMAEVAVVQKRLERAARLFGAAGALRCVFGAPRPPGFRAYCERDLAADRKSFGEAAFDNAWEEGEIMTLGRAVEYALEQQDGGAPARSGDAGGLSPREVEVLRLVANGLTDGQVAQRLHISPRTVGQHLHSVYKKLGVPSRAAAARRAVEQNLL